MAFLAVMLNLYCANWLKHLVVLLSELPCKVRYVEKQRSILKLYELIESSELEGSSGSHLVQPPCLSRAT